ncbi:MAG: uroporphyrinogen decarboxylase family protein [Propionivibrio sp.]
MRDFAPDYRHVIDAAYNREAKRLPLYEHGFDVTVIEKLLGVEVAPLLEGNLADKTEGYRRICRFGAQYGYDCIPYESLVSTIIQDGQGIMGRGKSLISSPQELESYPWHEKKAEYIARFEESFVALRAALPPGMKAVGGIGNGLFETVQDFVPFQELALLQVDEPEVFEQLWQKVGDLQYSLWQWLLANYADCFAVCRFGDDLGFKSALLMSPTDIRKHILGQYKRLVALVHAQRKPFLLHSCGKIYDVMDDLIDFVGIDAKHSNEDAIDTFDVWVNRYGDRIGNFGGIDMNVLTNNTVAEVKEYVGDLLPKVVGHGGVAIGTGNQISWYTLPENFVAMTEVVREWRKD